MKCAKSIRLCREIGIKGVVIGALSPRVIDCRHFENDPRGYRPVRNAGFHRPDITLTLVFHRAILMNAGIRFPLWKQIISLGFNTLLTSGHAPTAEQGIPIFKQLVERAAGRINIMAVKASQ
jgi:copper homeostasis protein